MCAWKCLCLCVDMYIYGVYICIYIYTLCLKTGMHDYSYADYIVFHVHVEKQKNSLKKSNSCSKFVVKYFDNQTT